MLIGEVLVIVNKVVGSGGRMYCGNRVGVGGSKTADGGSKTADGGSKIADGGSK